MRLYSTALGLRHVSTALQPVSETPGIVFNMAALKQVFLSLLACFAFVHSSEATCGGNFTATSGIITSPGFPNNYNNSVNCIYIITAPTNQRIMLNFTHFDLEAVNSTLCYDYVEMRDGNSSSSPKIDTFCNNTLPTMRISFGHQMWIHFFTDSSVVESGFRATYTTGTYDNSFFLIASADGSIIRMDAESISIHRIDLTGRNPIDVDFDPVEQRVYWSEAGPQTSLIASVSLTDNDIRNLMDVTIGAAVFGIAVDPFSRLLFYTDTGYDVIAMMSLSTFSHKTIINSSLDKPRDIVLHVTDGVMFWTDRGTPEKIERANYDGSDRRTLVHIDLFNPNALALDVANNRLYWADGGTDRVESVNLDGGDRSSPPILRVESDRFFYGMTLFRNALYITDWGPDKGKTESSQIIRKTLGAHQKKFTIHDRLNERIHDIHSYDQDWATSGPNGCGNNNGGCSSFCIPLPGNRSKCLCPDGESLLTDNTTCVNATCGWTFTETSGTITSPGFPNNYTNNVNCIYIITAPTNQRIMLNFTHFDLQAADGSHCYDFVEVRDGNSRSSRNIGTFCNNTLPTMRSSFGHHMWIKFFTDSSVVRSGFRATYTTAKCGWTFTATSGTIMSPGFPNNYTNNVNCIYIITAPTNQRIMLNFTHFDLQAANGSHCYDFVEVREGNSSFSPKIDTFCNNTLPTMRRSFGHQMWIKFVTDSSAVKSGFRATYMTGTYDNSFLLVASTGGSIIRMDTESISSYKIDMTLRNPIAVDFDPLEQRVYWSRVGTAISAIASASLTGNNIRIVKDNMAGAIIDGLAVDPFSRLLFYTDAGNNVIAMMTLSTFSHKTIINSSLDQPRAIVLHVTDGVMFWTDRGTPKKIERANYDGSDRRMLVMINLAAPNGLALDVASNRLYWADGRTDRVESVNLDGGDRSSPPILRVESARYFFGMTLFRNALYITDWGPDLRWTKSSQIIRKTLGPHQNNFAIHDRLHERMNDIHAYDQDWATSGPNGCGNSNGGCSSFCIPLPGNNSKCLCPDGESLLADNTTCVNARLISTPSKIKTTQRPITNTPTSTTTTTPTTPELTDIPVVVKASHDLPFIADRVRDLNVTCDLAVPVTRYAWNVQCSRKSGNWCVFRPTAEDDGKKVTCTVILADGRMAAGSLVLSLQYPPQTPPSIVGYESGSPLQVGDSLTMTCTVYGGKPLVSAVIFSCSDHHDNTRDMRGGTEVHSLMVISTLRKEDNGTRCVCSGQWLGSSVFYPPRHSVTLLVLGGTPVEGASAKKTKQIAIIGGAVGGVVVILIIVIIIVIVKRRNNTCNKKSYRNSKHRNTLQTDYDLDLNDPVYTEIPDLPLSAYAPADVPPLPDRPTTHAPPVPCSTRQTLPPADDYLTPTARQTPPPADDYLTPTARQTPPPADDYLTPTARQTPPPAYDYLTRTARQTPPPADDYLTPTARQTPPPADDYLTRTARQTPPPADDYLTPTARQTPPPADDYLTPTARQTPPPADDYLTPTARQTPPPADDYLTRTARQTPPPADDYLTPTARQTPPPADDYLTPTARQTPPPADDYLTPTARQTPPPADDYLTPTARQTPPPADDYLTRTARQTPPPADDYLTPTARQTPPPADDYLTRTARQTPPPADDYLTRNARQTPPPADDYLTPTARQTPPPADDYLTPTARQTPPPADDYLSPTAMPAHSFYTSTLPKPDHSASDDYTALIKSS